MIIAFRDNEDFSYQLNYLLNNAVKAGFVATSKEWRNTWVNEEFVSGMLGL